MARRPKLTHGLIDSAMRQAVAVATGIGIPQAAIVVLDPDMCWTETAQADPEDVDSPFTGVARFLTREPNAVVVGYGLPRNWYWRQEMGLDAFHY